MTNRDDTLATPHSGAKGANSGRDMGGSDETASEVDVVVPVFNALEFVRECVQSVLRHADRPLRLILVNDGSDEPTTAWLRETASAQPTVTLIEHAANRGYTAAINSGLGVSRSHAVVGSSEPSLTRMSRSGRSAWRKTD